MANLDHVVAFPASISLSVKHTLQSMSPEFDHRPIVVYLDHAVFGELSSPPEATNHHAPRIKMIDFRYQEPLLRTAMSTWWSDSGRKTHDQSPLHDAHGLQDLLNEASGAFAKV
jgi:hypothetical protein